MSDARRLPRGPHFDDAGRFRSDRHPNLKPDHVVIDFHDPVAWPALRMLGAAYGRSDFGAAVLARVTQIEAEADPEEVERVRRARKAAMDEDDELAIEPADDGAL